MPASDQLSGGGLPGSRVVLGRYSSVILSGFLILACLGCGVADRLKQVETVSNMKSVVGELEATRKASGGQLQEAQAKAIIEHSPVGHDGWGNRFLFFSQSAGGQFSYVLISPGSDGRLDLEPVEKYFSLKPSEIRGQPTRDIVFRDGQVVTNAGN